jgi:crossover junction endodeoxyribonuclease RusA
VLGNGTFKDGKYFPPMARVIISEQGRDYRKTVAVKILASGLVRKYGTMTGRVQVFIVLCPPDRRVRDIDNYEKPLIDALTHAHVWQDDSQIDDLHIVRGGIIRGGSVSLAISAITQPQQTLQGMT